MLVRPSDLPLAQQLMGSKVELIVRAGPRNLNSSVSGFSV
jgi:hypothetical protein